MKKIFYGLVILSILLTSSVSMAQTMYYGPTLENEHLYRIALRVRPDPRLSVQQVMIALLRKNPSAFNHQNVNFLKSGYRLVIPTEFEIAKINPVFALQQIEQQNKMWTKGTVAPVRHTHISRVVKTASPVQPPQSSTPSKEQTQADQTSQSTTIVAGAQTMIGENLNNFMQTTQQFQRDTTDLITSLQNKTKELESKVNVLNQQLSAMTYNIIQLNAAMKSEKSKSYASILSENINKYGLGLLASLLLLLTLIFLYRRTSRAHSARSGSSDSNEGEYNFLEGDDSIPTKLDLARAYIDMGDDAAARTTLNDVLAKGNAQQRQAAQELLSKLKLNLHL